jgi:four helix bundle protein
MDEELWKNLDIWKISDELDFKIYIVTKKFPREEVYGSISQIRRSALSIPTDIVEGYSSKGKKELSRFINITLGSLAETKYLLHFAYRMEYLK